MTTPIWAIADPRPDMATDADLWRRLLLLAGLRCDWTSDCLLATLHGLRCLGARLAVVGGRLALRAGELPADEYATVRARWLAPRRDELVALLDAIGGDAMI